MTWIVHFLLLFILISFNFYPRIFSRKHVRSGPTGSYTPATRNSEDGRVIEVALVPSYLC